LSFSSRSGSSRRRAPLPLKLGGIAVAAAAAIPLTYLVLRAAEAGPSRIADAVFRAETLSLLLRTIALTAAVTASAVFLGVALAWLTTRTDLPLRRLWAVLTAMPLVVPSYLAGFTFVAALGPRGALQRWLEPFGVERLPSLYGFTGAWIVLSLITYPYVLLIVRGAILGLDPALEEAAATLGLGRSRRALRVLIPQLRPAIVAGGLLAALYTLHDFGAVSLLRYNTFTRAIYVSYQGSFDRTTAAVLSLVLVLMTAAIVVIEARTRKRADYFRLHGGGGRRRAFESLGRGRWPAFLGCSLVAALGMVLPLAVAGYWLWAGVGAGDVDAGVSAEPVVGSLLASGLGTLACLAAATPVAALSARYGGRIASVVEKAVFLAFALPGVVVALALVFFGTRTAPFLYQTIWMLALAYALLFLPQAVGAMRASLLQLNPSLYEAALTLGRRPAAALGMIVVPLIRPGILAGGALVFLTAMKELPATLILSPPGFSTLATKVWGATTAASFASAAVPAILLLFLASVPVGMMLANEQAERS
jgi:iron(III) transport system permease protein